MRTFLIKITMPDGSQGRCFGLCTDGFAAISQTLESFPDAKSISARRLP